MIFQAYRSKFAVCSATSAVDNSFILNYPNYCVPAAPVRSGFAAAFEDVKRLRASGYVAAVRVLSFNQSTTI